MIKDYYKILGLPLTAKATDIKRCFRTLAKRYHPDRNAAEGAAQKFIEIEEAYTWLSDAKKKRAYDFIRKHGAAAAREAISQKKAKTKSRNRDRVNREVKRTRRTAQEHARMAYNHYKHTPIYQESAGSWGIRVVVSLSIGVILLGALFTFAYYEQYAAVGLGAFLYLPLWAFAAYSSERRVLKWLNKDKSETEQS